VSAWAVMVRDDNEEEFYYGPFRSSSRAFALASAITDRIDEFYEGPAWAYVVALEKPPRATQIEGVVTSAVDPDATA
jgi:hypothetical protein